MNNNIFYSIIIPVYNNSISDVYRCIDSLYRDILTNFEILLMDDGSEAGFARELDILAEKYSGIRVFHLPHKGASNARNEGILQASGKYLCFCDADDCVTKQFLFDLENRIDLFLLPHSLLVYYLLFLRSVLFRYSRHLILWLFDSIDQI